MQGFLDQHERDVLGVLSGFDRILFRGTLRSISYRDGMDKFLGAQGVLYKDFGRFAEQVSQKLKEHAHQFAKQQERPFEYLQSASISKEETARRIMERDGIQRGLICVLSCVEPCQTYALRRDAETKHLLLVPALRKCLHLYFYFVDREFGLIHVRLQTWLPMSMQVCLNGRESLARRMDRAGIGYQKQGNCFTRIDDLARAQQMMDDLTTRNWCHFLNALARRLNPWMNSRNPLDLRGYYWTLRESEYATDVMFRDTETLGRIYPSLVRHAVAHFDCQDVMRFLGRRTNARFNGEATSNVKQPAAVQSPSRGDPSRPARAGLASAA